MANDKSPSEEHIKSLRQLIAFAAKPGSKHLLYWASLLLVCVLAWMLRTKNGIPATTPDGVLWVMSCDAQEHLRRMAVLFSNFPYIPAVDFYTGYPSGTPPLWVPLFDYVPVVLAKLSGGGIPTVIFIASYLNPAFGVINTVLVAIVARHYFNSRVSVLSAAVFAMLQLDLWVSSSYDVGHHAAEVTVVLLFFMALAGIAEGGALRIGALAALFYISLFTWRGSTMIWVLFSMGVISHVVISRDHRFLQRYATAALLAGSAVALSCYFGFLGAFSNLNFNVASYLSAIILGGLWLLCPMMRHLSRIDSRRLVAACLITMVAISLLLIPLHQQIQAAVRFALVGDPWVNGIDLYHSIFRDADKGLLDRFFVPLTYMSLFYYLAPWSMLLMLKKKPAEGKEVLTRHLFLTCGTLLLSLPLIRMRYAIWTGPVIAICAGLLLGHEVSGKKYANAISLAACFLVFNIIAYSSNIVQPSEANFATLQAMVWLRDHSPQTSGHLSGPALPEYGVISRWDMGPYITNVARRPTVGTQYGWETYGLQDAALFISTDNDIEARRILKKDKVRYIFLDDVFLAEKSFLHNRRIASLPLNVPPSAGFAYRLMEGEIAGFTKVYQAVRAGTGQRVAIFERNDW